MKRLVILFCLLTYVGLWWQVKDDRTWSDQYLSPPMPVELLSIASGFARHMVGFGLFVKTSVFVGNYALISQDRHADNMAQNFSAATQLFPAFIDPYFFAQSFLPHVSPEHARATNTLLQRAIEQHPDDLLFPFFQGFNYFKYLDKPLVAADIFAELAGRPDAPPLFGLLSSKLHARGGQLAAGRVMLVVMYETETNEDLRERYAAEIENFDLALLVQDALNLYRAEHGVEATALEALVPQYLPQLPELVFGFILDWQPPVLKMTRPGK